jgi:hypothetical protein
MLKKWNTLVKHLIYNIIVTEEGSELHWEGSVGFLVTGRAHATSNAPARMGVTALTQGYFNNNNNTIKKLYRVKTLAILYLVSVAEIMCYFLNSDSHIATYVTCIKHAELISFLCLILSIMSTKRNRNQIYLDEGFH